MLKKSIFGLILATSFTFSGMVFAVTELSMWYHGAGNEVESKLSNKSFLISIPLSRTGESILNPSLRNLTTPQWLLLHWQVNSQTLLM